MKKNLESIFCVIGLCCAISLFANAIFFNPTPAYCAVVATAIMFVFGVILTLSLRYFGSPKKRGLDVFAQEPAIITSGMSCKDAISALNDTVEYYVLTNDEIATVWQAFMARCSIGLTEPDKTGWTDGQNDLWDALWESQLNPF